MSEKTSGLIDNADIYYDNDVRRVVTRNIRTEILSMLYMGEIERSYRNDTWDKKTIDSVVEDIVKFVKNNSDRNIIRLPEAFIKATTPISVRFVDEQDETGDHSYYYFEVGSSIEYFDDVNLLWTFQLFKETKTIHVDITFDTVGRKISFSNLDQLLRIDHTVNLLFDALAVRNYLELIMMLMVCVTYLGDE